jgi:hypothetical protein
MMPLLKYNIQKNKLLNETVGDGGCIFVNDFESGGGGGGGEKDGTCTVMELEWNHFISNIHPAKLIKYDVIVAADIVFPSNEDNFEALVETLSCLFASSAGTVVDQCEEEESRGPLVEGSNSSLQSQQGGEEGEGLCHRYRAHNTEGWMTYESRNVEVESRFWELLSKKNIRHKQMIAGVDFPPDLPYFSPDICIFRLFLEAKGN